jgi:hypothetical protein
MIRPLLDLASLIFSGTVFYFLLHVLTGAA